MTTVAADSAHLERETTPLSPAPFGPVTQADRLVNLDFVRGVALLGILLFNINTFFNPSFPPPGRATVSRLAPIDQAAALFVMALVAGKFISSFSMMFGYGLLGQVERAHAAGRSPGRFAFRRLGVLAVFGLLHALGLWYGDILFIYAALGVFVVLWRGNSAASLLIIAGVMLLCAAFVLLMNEAGAAVQAAPPHSPKFVGERGWDAIFRTIGGMLTNENRVHVWATAETIAYRDGPWSDVMAFRLTSWAIVVASAALGIWLQIVGMFALGAWMWRVRFFASEQAGLRRRVRRIFLPLGLLFAACAAGLYCLGVLADSPASWIAGGFFNALAVSTLALGYVSGLALLAERLPAGLVNAVASAGRMALTVYLSETLIATSLSYWWGLRWFGSVTPSQQLLLAVAIWTALVLFSRVWLTFFAQGPMEWLWRKLEYGRAR